MFNVYSRMYVIGMYTYLLPCILCVMIWWRSSHSRALARNVIKCVQCELIGFHPQAHISYAHPTVSSFIVSLHAKILFNLKYVKFCIFMCVNSLLGEECCAEIAYTKLKKSFSMSLKSLPDRAPFTTWLSDWYQIVEMRNSPPHATHKNYYMHVGYYVRI